MGIRQLTVAARVGVLAALLVLVAAGAGAGRRARVEHVGPVQQLAIDLSTIVLLLLLLVGAVGIVVFMVLSKGGEDRRQSKRLRGLRLLVLLVILMLLGGRKLLPHRFGDGGQARRGGAAAGAAGVDKVAGGPEAEPRWPVVLGGMGMVLVGGGLAPAAAVRRSRAGIGPVVDDEAQVDVLGDVTTTSMAVLDDEPDPRRAVLATYRAMEALLTSAGLPRRPSMTAFEYVQGALVGLGGAADPARRLVELFAVARYSTAAVSEADRSAARAALTELGARIEVSV